MEKRDLAVAIVADDLSGGADCGVGFSHVGLDVAVQLDRRAAPPEWAQAAVVSTDSRDQGPDDARAAVTEAIMALAPRHPAMWYKKIDSTLRGHLALELTVAIRGVRPELTVVAPAFPAHGRTVTDGHGFLDGTPLERTEVWRAQGLDGTADLRDMLRAGGLRVRVLDLAAIRSGRARERLSALAGSADVVVCDAETEDDLAAVAASGQATGLNVLWAGSAGLARHLAGLHTMNAAGGGGRGDGPSAVPPGDHGPVAVVVGSAAGAAAVQLRHLETERGVRVVRVRPAAVLSGAAADELATADRAIGEALAAKRDVALGLVPPGSPGGLVLDAASSRALSRALGQLVGRHNGEIGGFVLTGGDTALAVLAACGVRTLRLTGEVVTGVPVSVGCQDGRPVVTKAGAFGDEQVLARAVGVLRGHEVRLSHERNSFRASI